MGMIRVFLKIWILKGDEGRLRGRYSLSNRWCNWRI